MSTSMVNETTGLSHSIIDPYEHLQIIPNADGTITRNHNLLPRITPDPDHHLVLSKNVPVNPSKNIWFRIFVPRQVIHSSSTTKLPLIVYFHGGGFIYGSPDSNSFHDFCLNIAVELSVIIVSVDYRLAPEHRLPAAYDDAMEVLHCIKTSRENWLQKYVDFSSCFLMGSSAGGNIAYHAGLRATTEVDNLLPLKIRGLILHQPFFGGVKRTESESRLANNPIIPTCVTDLLWELSLPMGADRDHVYSNPTVGDGSNLIEQIKLLGWKVIVTGCNGDPLIDRQIELANIMEKNGVRVESHFDEGGYHGVEMADPARLEALQLYIKNFFLSSTA